MPQSPYIDRLRLDLSRTEDPAVRGVRRAELAACYARLGEFEIAAKEVADLRLEFGDGRSGRVSIMIMIAEAQLIYYRDLGDQARDRLTRAQLLSVAGRDAALTALTSAWLAHISFNLHRHAELARCAKMCIDTVSRDDHEAASRLALTLGDAFYSVEEPDMGNRWYSKAHEHAVKLGDHATIGALTYNRAAMGTFMHRLLATRTKPDPEIVIRLGGEVRTAINYQAVAQIRSLEPLLDYTLASAHILAEKYAEAVALLRKLVETKPATSPIDRSLVLQCDFALAMAMNGQLEDARNSAPSSLIDQLEQCTADDQVVAFSALIQVAELCDLHEMKAEAHARLISARAAHGQVVSTLREALIGLGDAASIGRR